MARGLFGERGIGASALLSSKDLSEKEARLTPGRTKGSLEASVQTRGRWDGRGWAEDPSPHWLLAHKDDPPRNPKWKSGAVVTCPDNHSVITALGTRPRMASGVGTAGPRGSADVPLCSTPATRSVPRRQRMTWCNHRLHVSQSHGEAADHVRPCGARKSRNSQTAHV